MAMSAQDWAMFTQRMPAAQDPTRAVAGLSETVRGHRRQDESERRNVAMESAEARRMSEVERKNAADQVWKEIMESTRKGEFDRTQSAVERLANLKAAQEAMEQATPELAEEMARRGTTPEAAPPQQDFSLAPEMAPLPEMPAPGMSGMPTAMAAAVPPPMPQAPPEEIGPPRPGPSVADVLKPGVTSPQEGAPPAALMELKEQLSLDQPGQQRAEFTETIEDIAQIPEAAPEGQPAPIAAPMSAPGMPGPVDQAAAIGEMWEARQQMQVSNIQQMFGKLVEGAKNYDQAAAEQVSGMADWALRNYGNPKDATNALLKTYNERIGLESRERSSAAMARSQASRTGGAGIRMDANAAMSDMRAISRDNDFKGTTESYESADKALKEAFAGIDKETGVISAAAYTQLEFGIASAREGGRLTNQDIERASGMTAQSWWNQWDQLVSQRVSGEGSATAVLQDMLQMVKITRTMLQNKAQREYKELREFRDDFGPDGIMDNPKAYARTHRYLKGLYGRMPWWGADGEPELRKVPGGDGGGGAGKSESSSARGQENVDKLRERLTAVRDR